MPSSVHLKSLDQQLCELISAKDKEVSKETLSQLDEKIKAVGDSALLFLFGVYSFDHFSKSIKGGDLIPLQMRVTQLAQETLEREDKEKVEQPKEDKKIYEDLYQAVARSMIIAHCNSVDAFQGPKDALLGSSCFYSTLSEKNTSLLLSLASVKPGHFLLLPGSWNKNTAPFHDHHPVYHCVIKTDNAKTHQFKFIIKSKDQYLVEDGTVIEDIFDNFLTKIQESRAVPKLTPLEHDSIIEVLKPQEVAE